MEASYAISLMLPLRLLLSLFLTKPKTHSGGYDRRWYGDVLVLAGPKPATNSKSRYNSKYDKENMNPLVIFGAIRRYTVWHGILRISQPEIRIDMIVPIRCMFWPEMGLRWHSLVQPTHQTQPASEPGGQIPPYNGKSLQWPTQQLDGARRWSLRSAQELTNPRLSPGGDKNSTFYKS